MAVVKVKRYNGMEFRDLVVSSSTVKTEVAVSVNDKIVVERPLTLQLHKNAYRYEPDLLLSTWSFEYPKIVPRGTVSSTYWRSEMIFCKASDYQKVRQWRDYFFDVANTLDCVLKGIIQV